MDVSFIIPLKCLKYSIHVGETHFKESIFQNSAKGIGSQLWDNLIQKMVFSKRLQQSNKLPFLYI